MLKVSIIKEWEKIIICHNNIKRGNSKKELNLNYPWKRVELTSLLSPVSVLCLSHWRSHLAIFTFQSHSCRNLNDEKIGFLSSRLIEVAWNNWRISSQWIGCRLDSECFHAGHLHSLISVTVTPSSFKRLINSTISTINWSSLSPFTFFEQQTTIVHWF